MVVRHSFSHTGPIVLVLDLEPVSRSPCALLKLDFPSLAD